ncbi:unnamed protein product [Mycena citricolor]|uniref:Zn(2)-C6 fungal-type domain-containing protein n=1 Tax=Mycena citricolor TaxID=2018698 RepID=A0AAD2HAU3_9AGAR|nr:unnamed protein product [Mycena citricolor]CAK5271569.1 unnamed protein product [Mycena citricolor]
MTRNLNVFPASPSRSVRHNLPRGKACMSCRRRKIKCDGRKPACGQCTRSSASGIVFDECEYPLEGRSRTQQLEETVKKLQSRIGELELAAGGGTGGVTLHEPYGGEDVVLASPGAIENGAGTWQWSMPASPRSTSPPSRLASPSSSSSSLLFEDPPADVSERLVDSFLTHFVQVGFFLDRAAFRHSALLNVSPGHPQRPSPALLSTVYLWGARLSRICGGETHAAHHEDRFLRCALQNMHHDLAGQHPRRVIYAIQAEVLLSLYYLTLGRAMEGTYHSSAAVSLAMSAGLHRIQSSSENNNATPNPGLRATPPLPEPERINAFWTAVIVNNYWVVAHGSPSAISYTDTRVDTPWPLDLAEYQSGAIDNFGGGNTIGKFLGGVSVDGFSSLALHAKASILLERAVSCADKTQSQAFDSLDIVLEQFMDGLPLGIQLSFAPVPKRCLVVIQTLTQAAIIRLHAHRRHTSEASRQRYIAAARDAVHIINNSDFSEWRNIDPIMTVSHACFKEWLSFLDGQLQILWTTVCDVFIGELTEMQTFTAVGRLTPQHQDVCVYLDTVLRTMRYFSAGNPLLDHSLNRIERTYRNLVVS